MKMRIGKWLLSALAAGVSLAFLAAEPSLHREKSFQAKPGGTLRVEAAFQDVLVTVRPGATVDVTVDVKVSGWGGSDEEFVKSCEPQFSETGDTILIRCQTSLHFTFGWRTTVAKIDVKMPPGMTIDASSGSGDCVVKGDTGGFPVNLHTGSGDVGLEGACKALSAKSGSGGVKVSLTKEAERAEIQTGSGNIQVAGPVRELSVETGSGDVRADLKGGKGIVSLRSGSGDLELKGGAADLKAKSGSGGISAEGLTGSAAMKTGSGDITVRWAKAPHGGKMEVESSSGHVQLTFPADASFTGLLRTSSGDVRCDFPGAFKGSRKQSFALTGPQGSADLSVETSSGDIQVLAAK
jgi:DUF4097 and DUF4098 domain-containing protein YvlB